MKFHGGSLIVLMQRERTIGCVSFAWTRAESRSQPPASGMDICEQRGSGLGNSLTVVCNGGQRIRLLKGSSERRWASVSRPCRV